jgi:hypothetical protein
MPLSQISEAYFYQQFAHIFVPGDTMCCFDCELMPKLQHIRVAGQHFADFQIPNKLAALWRLAILNLIKQLPVPVPVNSKFFGLFSHLFL